MNNFYDPISYRRTVSHLGWALCLMLVLMQTLSMLPVPVSEILLVEGLYTASVMVGGVLDTVCYLGYFIIPGVIFYGMMRKYPTVPIRFDLRLPAVTPLLIFAGIAMTQAAGYLNYIFTEAIGYRLPDELFVSADMTNPAVVIMYMTTAFAPAIAEEFLFRGVVFGNLRPYGRTVAVLGSALLFGLMHQNIGQILYAFAIGVIFALIYEATGSIWVTTFIHLFNNELSVIQSILYEHPDADIMEAVITLVFAAVYFAGAISIVVLLALSVRHRDRNEIERRQGFFGRHSDAFNTSLSSDAPSDAKTAFRHFFTAPGMLTFFIGALGMTALMYLIYA